MARADTLIGFVLAVSALSGAASLPSARPGSDREPPCSCPTLLELAIGKVEDTYIGYRLEVDSAARPAYEVRKEEARRRAARPGADCIQVLSDWIDGFHDGHLFLFEQPKFTAGQLDSLKGTAVHTGWTKERIRAALGDATALDPVEGFWYSAGDRFDLGIVRDPDDDSTFLAIVTSTTAAGWTPGELKARIRKLGDGRYSAVYRMDDQSTRRYEVWMSRGSLLQMPGGVAWGKRSPVPSAERGTLDPEDPLAPTLRAAAPGVIVVSVPSHGGRYRGRLDTLVAGAKNRLLAASLLVVDLRGDIGGGSLTTTPLMPFIYARPERTPPGPQGRAAVVASASNLKYFRSWTSEGATPQWILDLLGRMGQHFGEIVDFQTGPDTTEGWAPDTSYATPRHVALLTDRNVASAGEAFVLFALHSPRVTTFGQPTWGMIDYQNAVIVPLGCPGSGLYLGYPTIAASRDLPKGGLNHTGIVPDVPLDLSRGDPILEIIDHYGSTSG